MKITTKLYMKIILISQVFDPDPISTSQLFSPLIKNIATEQIKFDVFTAKTVKRHKNYKFDDNVKVIECGFAFSSKNLFLKLINHLSFVLIVFFKILFIKGEFKILALTNPPFNIPLMYILNKIKRIEYYLFLLDVFPEGLKALGTFDNKLLIYTWEKINKKSYKNASKVICLGRDMLNLIRDKYEIDTNKLSYIPHWSAVEKDVLSIEESLIYDDERFKDKFIVQYSGNMGLWHDIQTYIYAANDLKNNEEIVFHFIGGGIKKDKAYKLAMELSLENIVWSDFVPYTDLDRSLAGCHVSLLTLNNGFDGVAVPCKFYGILQSGRPVFASVPKDSEISIAINEDNTGKVFEPGDYKNLSKEIVKLSKNMNHQKELSKNARQSYENKYTIKKATDKFINEIIF